MASNQTSDHLGGEKFEKLFDAIRKGKLAEKVLAKIQEQRKNLIQNKLPGGGKPAQIQGLEKFLPQNQGQPQARPPGPPQGMPPGPPQGMPPGMPQAKPPGMPPQGMPQGKPPVQLPMQQPPMQQQPMQLPPPSKGKKKQKKLEKNGETMKLLKSMIG